MHWRLNYGIWHFFPEHNPSAGPRPWMSKVRVCVDWLQNATKRQAIRSNQKQQKIRWSNWTILPGYDGNALFLFLFVSFSLRTAKCTLWALTQHTNLHHIRWKATNKVTKHRFIRAIKKKNNLQRASANIRPASSSLLRRTCGILCYDMTEWNDPHATLSKKKNKKRSPLCRKWGTNSDADRTFLELIIHWWMTKNEVRSRCYRISVENTKNDTAKTVTVCSLSMMCCRRSAAEFYIYLPSFR